MSVAKGYPVNISGVFQYESHVNICKFGIFNKILEIRPQSMNELSEVSVINLFIYLNGHAIIKGSVQIKYAIQYIVRLGSRL